MRTGETPSKAVTAGSAAHGEYRRVHQRAPSKALISVFQHRDKAIGDRLYVAGKRWPHKWRRRIVLGTELDIAPFMRPAFSSSTAGGHRSLCRGVVLKLNALLNAYLMYAPSIRRVHRRPGCSWPCWVFRPCASVPPFVLPGCHLSLCGVASPNIWQRDRRFQLLQGSMPITSPVATSNDTAKNHQNAINSRPMYAGVTALTRSQRSYRYLSMWARV